MGKSNSRSTNSPTSKEVQSALESASGVKNSIEKMTNAAEKLLKKQGITSSPSQSAKAIRRVKGIFDTAKEILKPLEAAFAAIAHIGVGLDIYSNLGGQKSSELPQDAWVWLPEYRKTHQKIAAIRKHLTQFQKKGLPGPPEVNVSPHFSKLLKPSSLKSGKLRQLRRARAYMSVINALSKNITSCETRIKWLKTYNKQLFDTYVTAAKRKKYASELLKKLEMFKVIYLIIAVAERKADSVSLSGVQFDSTFENAKGDWGGLSQDCLRARKKATAEIYRLTTRLKKEKILLRHWVGSAYSSPRNMR